ncbi:hypothetical protein QQS21_008427 [Conoideocrella luteorostrata]|uniref:PH domain-containing protein n=1 Tax=Conoideocrella luteorostrata TaxID=1105319 RepID=A0AAJ0FYP0_9HYPO|nr:hypothetical protein QQS21_008427 [Conoideocrella luteorostrata]
MAREFGPIEAVPPPPPQSFSRYRTLRGKSVSSPRDFDVFHDSHSSAESDYSSDGPGQSNSGSPRSRSKSVSSFRHALQRQETVPAVPAVPALQVKVLCPKPINIAAQSSLKILENLKSPIFNPENRPWKSLANISKPANYKDGTTTTAAAPNNDGGSAAAGPQLQGQQESHQDDQLHLEDLATQQPNVPPNKDESRAEDTAHATEEPKAEDTAHAKEEPETGDNSEGNDERDPGDHHHHHLQKQEQEPQQYQATEGSKGSKGSKGSGVEHLLADEVARLNAETDRILAEQKKLDLARLQAQLVTPPKPKRQILEKLSFFTRSKRLTAASSQPGTPSTIVSAIFSPALSHYSRDSDSSLEESPTSLIPNAKMSFIEPGGKGIVPQMDAPVSAINGGERRVIVRCLSSTINLPVTAETSPVDILKAATEMTRHHLSLTTSVIVECYFVLGLERRLRRYERIRDVMNSWDRDQQNSLLIMSCDDIQSDSDHDLELESVPRTEEPPSGFSMQMYHSSKPGKWNKRWVTLLENGQIYVAKSANAKASDKDSAVLCHLTDFDIYAPKESEMRRNLKPPKKFCYAIKSQQKTVVFPNGENFVHFFSTEDAQQAARFYEKVHGWRSWYMVNRMVDFEQKKKPPQLVLDANISSLSPKKSIKSKIPSAQVSDRTEEQEVGEPLMDVNEFRMSKIMVEGANANVRKSLSLRSKGSVRYKQAPTAPEIPRTVNEHDSEFFAGGLLGDIYEKRKLADTTSPTSFSQVSKTLDGPFTEAPSLLNGGIGKCPSDSSDVSKRQTEQEGTKTEPRSWFPSAAEHSARTRQHPVHTQQQRRPMTADTPSSSGAARRERHPAPLLSFPKELAEPPRFQNGPKSGVRHAPGQPLINYATGGAAREPRDSAVKRSVSRRGMPASTGSAPSSQLPSQLPPPQHPPPPPRSHRQRSKSTASQRRYNPNDAQNVPVPPMPTRRPQHGEPPSRPPPRCPAEPLVHRAR